VQERKDTVAGVIVALTEAVFSDLFQIFLQTYAHSRGLLSFDLLITSLVMSGSAVLYAGVAYYLNYKAIVRYSLCDRTRIFREGCLVSSNHTVFTLQIAYTFKPLF
jgi:hypothetical protein